MTTNTPAFIQNLRNQIESEIDAMRKKMDALIEEAERLEGEINERRNAIQRLIGVVPIERVQPKKERKPPAHLSEERVRDAIYSYRNVESFSLTDLADNLNCSRVSAGRYARQFCDKGTLEIVREGKPGVPMLYKFRKVS